MLVKLEKINPEFRQLVDLFLFSNRLDLDLSKFKDLFKLNDIYHYDYFISQFYKSLNIFWENSEEIWNYRLDKIFSLNEKTISDKVFQIIEKRMLSLIINKKSPHPKYDIEFSQFLSLCKTYYNPNFIKTLLVDLSLKVNAEKLINIVNYTIPFLFKNIYEYAKLILNDDISLHHYSVLQLLERKGIKYNKKPLIKLIKTILNNKTSNRNMHYMVLKIINDIEIRELLKANQNQKFQKNLLRFVRAIDISFYDKKCKDILNIIDICPKISDDVGITYIDFVYTKSTLYKQSRANMIINLLSKVPQISKKKILSYLASRGKHSDIKCLVSNFPELADLAAFL